MMRRLRNLTEAAAPWSVIGVMVAIAVVGMVPPTAAPADAAATEFSAHRAFAHVEAIATEPRPSGSPASAAARDYLVEELEGLGLTPSLPSLTVPDYFGLRGEVPIVDIVALLGGTDSTGAIVLMAHYDTVPETPGANDNATAVAAVIEAARALIAGSPLRNDVILLITDGEEPEPRYGSTAFVDFDPLFPTVRLVINLEAIGNSGISSMTEVAGNEGFLLSQYAAAATRPAASSVVDDIAELLGGSNTDFAPFRDRGVAGFEFAYLLGSPIYHTPDDDIDSVNLGSLQHHGTQILGLAQRFGDLDLSQMGDDSQEVFFTLAGSVVIHYPAWAGMVLVALAGLLLAVSIRMTYRREPLPFRSLAAGAGLLLLVALAAGVLTAVVWRVLVELLWDSSGPRGIAAIGWMMGLVALAVGATVLAHRRLATRFGSTEMEWAAVALWWLLAAVASMLMPGVGYLFLWPVMAAAAIGAFRPKRDLATLSLVAAPAVVLAFPVIDTLFQFGLPRPGNPGSQIPEIVLVLGLVVSLLVALLLPHFRTERTGRTE